MSDEKSKTMAERIAPLLSENDRIARFDVDRELRPGQLTPRQRLQRLVDDGSLLELARLAHSQHEEAGPDSVSDGVIAGYGSIGGHLAAFVAEDRVALAATDGQVGKNKRLRLIDQAVFRRRPLVYLADGAEGEPPNFGHHHGMLITRIADQMGGRDISERHAPFVAVVLGRCRGQEAVLAARADLIIVTPDADLTVGGGSGPHHSASMADVVAADDAAALDAARRFLTLTSFGARRPAISPPVVEAESDPLLDYEPDATAERLCAGLLDAGSLLRLSPAGGLLTGIGTVLGQPLAIALAAGGRSRSLGVEDLARLRRVAEISARFGLPLLVTQDLGGYPIGAGDDAAFLRLLAETTEILRRSDAPRFCLVTGVGHILGDYVLGGAGLGFDFTWAWPGASMSLRDTTTFTPEAEGLDTPWDAADFGIIDDVIKPSETRTWVGRAIGMLAPAYAFSEEPLDRGLAIYDMV